ncbi:hypothetical protein Agub_g9348, partial [Astrephomene gubernaculifera]
MPLLEPANRPLQAAVIGLVLLHFGAQMLVTIHQLEGFKLNRGTLASLAQQLLLHPAASPPGGDANSGNVGKGNQGDTQPAAEMHFVSADWVRAVVEAAADEPDADEVQEVVEATAEEAADAADATCSAGTSANEASASQPSGRTNEPKRVTLVVHLFARQGGRPVLPGQQRNRSAASTTASAGSQHDATSMRGTATQVPARTQQPLRPVYDLSYAVHMQMLALMPRLSLLLAPALAASGVRLPSLEWWQRQRLPAVTTRLEPPAAAGGGGELASAPPYYEGDAVAECSLQTSPSVRVLARAEGRLFSPVALPLPLQAPARPLRRAVCRLTPAPWTVAAAAALKATAAGVPNATAAAAAGTAPSFTVVVWEELDSHTRALQATTRSSGGGSSGRRMHHLHHHHHHVGSLLRSGPPPPPGWLSSGLNAGSAHGDGDGGDGSDSGGDWVSWLTSLATGKNGGTLYYCAPVGWLTSCDPSAFDAAAPHASGPSKATAAAAAAARGLHAGLSHGGGTAAAAAAAHAAAARRSSNDVTEGGTGPLHDSNRFTVHPHRLRYDGSGGTWAQVWSLLAYSAATAWRFSGVMTVLLGHCVDWGLLARAGGRVAELATPLLLPHAAALRWMLPLALPDVAGGRGKEEEEEASLVGRLDLAVTAATAAACCYAEWLLLLRLLLRWRADRLDERGVRLDVDTAGLMRARVWREAVEGPVGRSRMLVWRWLPSFWRSECFPLTLLAGLQFLRWPRRLLPPLLLLAGPATAPDAATATAAVAAAARAEVANLTGILHWALICWCRQQQWKSMGLQAYVSRMLGAEVATRASKPLLQVAATSRMLHDIAARLPLRLVARAAQPVLGAAGGAVHLPVLNWEEGMLADAAPYVWMAALGHRNGGGGGADRVGIRELERWQQQQPG